MSTINYPVHVEAERLRALGDERHARERRREVDGLPLERDDRAARHLHRPKRTAFLIVQPVQRPDQCTRLGAVRQAGQLGQFASSQRFPGENQDEMLVAAGLHRVSVTPNEAPVKPS